MIRFIIATWIVLLPMTARAQQTLHRFSLRDIQTSIGGNKPLKSHRCELASAFNGTDDSAFEFDWHDAVGNFPIAHFDAPAGNLTMYSLRGWIHIGPVVLHPGPIRLMLVYSDNYEAIDQIEITDSGQFIPFAFALPINPRMNKFTLLMHVPDTPTEGNVIFSDIELVASGTTTAPAAGATPVTARAWPSTMPAEQLVRRFLGNDFNPSADNRLDTLGMNPVTISVNHDTREIDVQVPSPDRVIPVLSVDDPGITCADYAIAGDISYGSVHAGFRMSNEGISMENNLSDGDIEAEGYLEMWSDFADGSSYFTRTLAGSGPMRMLKGRSGPRVILLPFHSGNRRPTRIRMDLIMPGRGTVSLANLRLVEYPKPVAPVSAGTAVISSPLFNPRLIWLPIIFLPFFSLVALLEPLVLRGRGRGFVMIWIWTFFALSQLSFGWAMAAWGHGLPLREVGPTLFVSALISFCTLFSSRRMPQRYQTLELKRMQLMDSV